MNSYVHAYTIVVAMYIDQVDLYMYFNGYNFQRPEVCICGYIYQLTFVSVINSSYLYM